MDRIPRGKESVVDSLTSVSKQLVVVLFVCLLALSAPSAMAQTAAVIDDFEDQDLTEWGVQENGYSIGSNSFEGDYALQYDPGGSYNGLMEDVSDPTEVMAYIHPDENQPSLGHIRFGLTGPADTDLNTAWVDIQEDGSVFYFDSGSSTDSGQDIALGKYYRVRLYNIDYQSETYDWEVRDAKNDTVEVDGTATMPSPASGQRMGFSIYDSPGSADYVTINGADIQPTYTISGDVTDSNRNDLNNVTVEARNESGDVVATDTTGQLGGYSLSVENGTYNVTASKQNYSSETQQVTVEGSDQTVDFQLSQFDQSITLDSRMYMEYGQSAPYDVVVNVDGDRRGVTENATVTSGNTSVVTIDDSEQEVVATNDTSVNQRTYVQATWNDSEGNTYTARRNVTVANATVENIEILPDFTRFTASLSDETVMVIIIATGVGTAAALFATSFAGVSAVTMVMLLGWLAGYVNNGMAILAVLMAMFVGMNVAGNVDYTVRR